MSDQMPEVLCEMNEYGTYTWVHTDKVLTEFDPWFIVAYGYQNTTDADGEKHVVWMTLSGAQTSLSRTVTSKDDAMSLLNKIRKAKRKN